MELGDEDQETLGLIVQSCLEAMDENNSSVGSSSNHGSSYIDIIVEEPEVIGTGRSVGNEENRGTLNVPTLEGINVDLHVGMSSERPQNLLSARSRNASNSIDTNFRSSNTGKRLSGKMVLKQLTMSRSSVVMSGSSNSNLPEEDKVREHGRMEARLQRRMLHAEDELKILRVKNQELDQNCIKLGSENQNLLNEINSLNALKKDLFEKEKHINERIMEEMAKERQLMNGEIKAHKMQFDYELGEKDKRIKELQAQLQNINLEHDKGLERLQDELQESKDQIIMLKRHETTIEVYEKKMEEMVEVRADLTTAQKINKRLEADIAILESTQGKEHALQEMVTKLQQELGQAAVKFEMADLKLKEEKFAKKDAEERLRGYQDKETFYKNQLDKLNLEASQLSEELRITKATAQPSTRNDHEIA